MISFFFSPWLATYLAMKCSEYCSFARNFYSSWFSSYTVRWERGVVLRQCSVQYCHNICHLKKKCNANEISYCVWILGKRHSFRFSWERCVEMEHCNCCLAMSFNLIYLFQALPFACVMFIWGELKFCILCVPYGRLPVRRLQLQHFVLSMCTGFPTLWQLAVSHFLLPEPCKPIHWCVLTVKQCCVPAWWALWLIEGKRVWLLWAHTVAYKFLVVCCLPGVSGTVGVQSC